MQAGQHFLTDLADRPIGQRHEVKVADTRDIVPCRQGTHYQQVGHPSEADQTIRKISYGR